MDKLCLSWELQGEGGESIAEDRNRDNQTKKRKLKKKLHTSQQMILTFCSLRFKRLWYKSQSLLSLCTESKMCSNFFWESLLIRCLTAVTALPVHLFIFFFLILSSPSSVRSFPGFEESLVSGESSAPVSSCLQVLTHRLHASPTWCLLDL